MSCFFPQEILDVQQCSASIDCISASEKMEYSSALQLDLPYRDSTMACIGLMYACCDNGIITQGLIISSFVTCNKMI